MQRVSNSKSCAIAEIYAHERLFNMFLFLSFFKVKNVNILL